MWEIVKFSTLGRGAGRGGFEFLQHVWEGTHVGGEQEWTTNGAIVAKAKQIVLFLWGDWLWRGNKKKWEHLIWIYPNCGGQKTSKSKFGMHQGGSDLRVSTNRGCLQTELGCLSGATKPKCKVKKWRRAIITVVSHNEAKMLSKRKMLFTTNKGANLSLRH